MTENDVKTIDWWATELCVTKDAIQKFAAQQNTPIEGQEMPTELLNVLLPKWSIKRGQRTEQTVEAARRLATQLGIQIQIQEADEKEPGPSPKPIMPRRRWNGAKPTTAQPQPAPAPAAAIPQAAQSKVDQFFRARTFLFGVFLAAMAWQIEHTTTVAIRLEIGDKEPSTWQIALGYLFSMAVQFTALLMTINKGGKAYLVTFAVAEFALNLIYYRPWNTMENYERWFTSVLISAIISYVIFSYSELFTDKNSRQ